MSIDADLKLAIYRHTAATTRPPSVAEMAAAMACTETEVRGAFQRLYASRVLVLDSDGESIQMAPPFSGVETQHRVLVSGEEYFANCAWDAFGVVAALGEDGDIFSRCEQSAEPLEVQVRGGEISGDSCVVHYAVPAAHWWDDIVYT